MKRLSSILCAILVAVAVAMPVAMPVAMAPFTASEAWAQDGLDEAATGSGIETGSPAEVSLAARLDEPPWTGQAVTLNLDLKTPALSFADIHFNLPEVPGALLLRSDSTTIKGSQRRGTKTWQVLTFPITLFPQQSGELTVPSFEVRFQTQNGFGTAPVTHVLSTDPLSLTVRQPPGVAPGSVVVTTTRHTLQSQWQLPPEPVQAGDAIQLTVDRQAAGLSGILLPPLPVFEAEGLAAYPAEPEIADQVRRGALTGTRRDQVTWIIERPGDYRLPAIVFRSWDPVQEVLDAERVEGVTLRATTTTGTPDESRSSAAAPGTPDRKSPWSLLGAILAAAFTIGFGWRFRLTLVGGLRRLRVRILPPARALLPSLNPGDSR